jgi:hypothetical protein
MSPCCTHPDDSHGPDGCEARGCPCEKAELDLAAATRARKALDLVRDVNGGKSGTHDDACHHRHAACLARKVREALTLDGDQ